jgi:hypothetical protein
MKFTVGDVVVSFNGKRPARITHISTYYVHAKYLHNGASIRFASNNIKLYEEETAMSQTNTLYQVKLEDGTITFGIHVGTNSSNQLLIEEKGTGRIIFASKSQVEEVLPFTFSVRQNGKTVHYLGEPDRVAKGDVLLYTGEGADRYELALVTAVNTKNKSATKTFQGKKVLTEEI